MKSDEKKKRKSVTDKIINPKKEELAPTIVRWIQLLKALKLRQLKSNIDDEMNNYEINKNINDKLLLFLDDELKENEISEKIDELKNSKVELLFEIHKQNMNNLQKKFEQDIQKIFQDYEKDETILLNNRKDLIKDINRIYQRIEEYKKKRKKKVEEEEQEIMENIYKNYIGERYIINYNIEKFKKDDENLNTILIENQKTLNEENEHFNTIQMELEKSIKKLHSKEKEVHDLQLKIDGWKLKLENEVNIYEGQIEKLKNEKTLLLNHIKAIKLILQKLKHNDKQRLIDISVNLNNCLDKLQEDTTLANKIINFNNLCRKYETDREKHFLLLETSDEKKEPSEKENEFPYMDSFKMNDKNFLLFENFFKRQNKVVLDLMILKKQLQELKRKNKQYKSQIHHLKNKYDVQKKVQITEKDFLVNVS